MSDPKDPLVEFSDALIARTETAKSIVAAVRFGHGRHVTGIVWPSGVVVASEQALPRQEDFELVAPGGATIAAKIAGRARTPRADPTARTARGAIRLARRARRRYRPRARRGRR